MIRPVNFIAGGGKILQEYLNSEIAKGNRRITVTGDYWIEKAITVPSNTTVILDGCRLSQAYGYYDRVFVSESVGAVEAGFGTFKSENIHIIGINGAIIDGGRVEETAFEEKNDESEGSIIEFANVDNFSIQNVKIICNRWKAFYLVNCSRGLIKNVAFKSDFRRFTKSGATAYGLVRKLKDDVCIKEADGIAVRYGSHDIVIDSISGFCGQDMISVVAERIDGDLSQSDKNAYDGIYNIYVKNVSGCAFRHIVNVDSQDGTDVSGIIVENVKETDDSQYYFDEGEANVQIGHPHVFRSGEKLMSNIVLKKIDGRQKTVVKIDSPTRDLSISEVTAMAENQIAVDPYVKIFNDEKLEREEKAREQTLGKKARRNKPCDDAFVPSHSDLLGIKEKCRQIEEYCNSFCEEK